MQREYELLIHELLRLLLEEFGDRVRSLLVFGSVARGTVRPDSDGDMCVVIRELPVSRHRRHQLLGPVLDRLRNSAAYEDLIRRGHLMGSDLESCIPFWETEKGVFLIEGKRRCQEPISVNTSTPLQEEERQQAFPRKGTALTYSHIAKESAACGRKRPSVVSGRSSDHNTTPEEALVA